MLNDWCCHGYHVDVAMVTMVVCQMEGREFTRYGNTYNIFMYLVAIHEISGLINITKSRFNFATLPNLSFVCLKVFALNFRIDRPGRKLRNLRNVS